jgi:hypothetical protein
VLNVTVKYHFNSMAVVIFFWCIEYPSPWEGIDFATLVIISTDCICSCQYNMAEMIHSKIMNQSFNVSFDFIMFSRNVPTLFPIIYSIEQRYVYTMFIEY